MKLFFDKLYRSGKNEFFSGIEENLKSEKRTFVVTANPEIFMQADENRELSELLLDPETTVIADGIGIVKGARILGFSVRERIPVVELAEFLLDSCNRLEKSVYLFGAKKEVLDALCNVIAEKYPKLNLAGVCDGYVPDKDAVFEEISEVKPDLILVALGVPQQEQLIYRHFKKFPKV